MIRLLSLTHVNYFTANWCCKGLSVLFCTKNILVPTFMFSILRHGKRIYATVNRLIIDSSNSLSSVRYHKLTWHKANTLLMDNNNTLHSHFDSIALFWQYHPVENTSGQKRHFFFRSIDVLKGDTLKDSDDFSIKHGGIHRLIECLVAPKRPNNTGMGNRWKVMAMSTAFRLSIGRVLKTLHLASIFYELSRIVSTL